MGLRNWEGREHLISKNIEHSISKETWTNIRNPFISQIYVSNDRKLEILERRNFIKFLHFHIAKFFIQFSYYEVKIFFF